MHNQPSVSLIIVNYNIANEIDQCLKSILKYTGNIFEIIVVDNNSTERDIENLIPLYPSVTFHLLKENLGFAGANNFAAQKSNNEYLLFLNPDTLLVEDFISPIIDFINSDENAGACGPMLLNPDMSTQNSTGIKLGYVYELSEAFMLINYLRKMYRNKIEPLIKTGAPFEVHWLSAACMMMRKGVFEKVGGFNTEFFLNYEDIDLCERIRKAGYKNYYFPRLKCIHIDHKSQTKNLERMVFSRYQSRIIYSKSHYNFTKRTVIKSAHILGLLLRLVIGELKYSGTEKIQRKRGYQKALKLYLYGK